jgi:uncharacterized cupin superfamily protein
VQHVTHWDEVEPRRRDVGHLAGTWRDLGTAVGTQAVGVNRIDVDPGKWSTPAHVEGADEEIFFVLEGSGRSWQDGAVYEVASGDCLVHLPQEEAHTLRAGPDGLSVLAFGHRALHGNTVLPRAGVAWVEPAYVDVTMIGDKQHPFLREAEAGEPEVGEPQPRPRSIVNVADVEPYVDEHGDSLISDRDLGSPAGSSRTGLSHMTLVAGRSGYPPHCHSADEEIFVVLEGDGTVALGDESYSVRSGSIVGRPPGTRVPHSFRAGESDLVYLAYGTREPNDIAYYPRSGKVNLRGIGVIGRIEPVDYWDGES